MGKTRKILCPAPVLPHVFKALERADMLALSQCREEEIRPILPCLVRMSLIAAIENTIESTEARKAILKILSGIEPVNSLVALLSVDFVTLETDIKKEQQLRQKAGGIGCGGPQEGGVLVQNLINGLALEFECSEPLKRLRLLLSEIIYVMAQVKELRPTGDWFHKDCELFDNQCYFEEIADILSIGVSELPGLLNPGELAETLLHFTNAPHLISRIVANQPDYFKEILTSLIINGEAQDEETEGGLVRLNTIRTLCLMNPPMALHARHLCVENCRMPGLAVFLTLDAAKNWSPRPPEGEGATEVADVISFVTGLLLSPDQQQRAWFSLYVKNAQKRKWEHPHSGLAALRAELSDRLCALQVFRTGNQLPATQVIPATALLRLYTALKNLPGIKLQEEREATPLLQLLTCQPPKSAGAVRFVSTGLCVLIACPQLLASQETERRAADWIKWLVKEEVHFSGALGVWSSNFGALLLLVAIHFHVGQLSAILELVSQALGMKVLTRPSSLSTIKRIITQEVFTESVVTSIAAKVSVTQGLDATKPGHLPAHCVFHLLKSRMFTRHKVNIKNWIYKQICSSRAPMHPILPPLVEVFVRSVVGGGAEATNDPITEAEILAVFKLPSFSSDTKTQSASLKQRPRLRCSATHCPESTRGTEDIYQALGGVTRSEKKTPHLVQCPLTSQLLLLYYLLLYEDCRVTSSPPPAKGGAFAYSPSLFSQLPIRYLLSRAQRDQAMYAGLYSALLKLLAHHYPQLCLAEDWLYSSPRAPPAQLAPRIPLTPHTITTAMAQCATSPGLLLVLLERCLLLPSFQLWHVAALPLTRGLCHLLEEHVPRTVLDKFVLVWRRLNAIYPRRLWAMTVEGLRAPQRPPDKGTMWAKVPSRRPLTEDDLVLDPLYVLRCDPRVFRRAPLLQVVEHILQVYLLSSRTFLSAHQHSTPLPGMEEQRDKLRGALVLTQESTAIQILLESTLVQHKDVPQAGSRLALQEVQSVVFSYLHQAFIKDTTLAKLVHFQGYPRELIGPVVQGVPSMHIAVGLNWIPELLQLPHQQHPHRQHQSMQQLLFTLQLAARLALQNAMPPSLSIARLAISVIATLISVLNSAGRLTLVRGSVGPLVTLGAVFPCLLPELVGLLHTCARLARAHASILPAPGSGLSGVLEEDTAEAPLAPPSPGPDKGSPMECEEGGHCAQPPPKRPRVGGGSPVEEKLVGEVNGAFRRLVEEVARKCCIY